MRKTNKISVVSAAVSKYNESVRLVRALDRLMHNQEIEISQSDRTRLYAEISNQISGQREIIRSVSKK